MYESAILPVIEPVVYTPPPPPKPNPTVSVARCVLCQALLSFGSESRHRDWHLVNGLHGADCALLASMAEQRGAGAYAGLQACSCGLDDNDKKGT